MADEARRKNITREQAWRREKKLRFNEDSLASGRLPTSAARPKPPLVIRKVPSERKVVESTPPQVGGHKSDEGNTAVLERIPERFTNEYNYAPENLSFWTQFDVDWKGHTPDQLASWAPAMPVSTRKQEERRRALKKQKAKARERQRKALQDEGNSSIGSEQERGPSQDLSLKSKLENLRFMERKSYGWFRQEMQGFEKATWHESLDRFEAWKLDFAELVEEVDGGGEVEVSLLGGHRRRQYRDHVSRLLAITDDQARSEEWQRYVSEELREHLQDAWPQLVLACLRYFPTKVDLLIKATWEDSWRLGESVTPPWIVQDAIWLLIRHPAIKLNGGFCRKLFDLMLMLMAKSPRSHLRFRQWDIFQLVDNLPKEEQVEELYRALVEYGHPLHFNTLQQIADRLARDVAFKSTALEIIEYLVNSKQLDVNSPHIGALVTTLLSFKDQQSPDDLPVVLGKPAEYFERVLELGFTPNLFTYSVLICNICRCGSMREALSVLGIMRGQNMEPDAVLYSYLLHTAKQTQDWNAMALLLQQASSQNVRDPVVWNEPLHFVYKAFLAEARHRVSKRELVPRRVLPAFEHMIKIYGNIFNPDLLRKFIPWDLDPLLNAEMKLDTLGGWEAGMRTFHMAQGMPSWGERGLLEPGYDTISIMLMGFMSTYSNPQAAFALYRHVRKMLDAGDPDVVGFVQKTGTLVYDLVLRSMLAEKSYFGLCFGILNEMIGRSELAATSSSSGHRELPLTQQTQTTTSSTANEESQAQEIDTSPSPPPEELKPQPYQGPSTARTAAEYWHPPPQPPQDTKIIFCHPPPSTHTWSILLHGLMHHHEAEHAERVLKLMPEYGVQPNTVSWNTMLAGYARQQNTRMTVKTLKRLEASGVEASELTYTAFSYLDNRDAALRMMEKLTKKRSERLAGEPVREDPNPEEGEGGRVVDGLELAPEVVQAEMEAWEGSVVEEDMASQVQEKEMPSKIRIADLMGGSSSMPPTRPKRSAREGDVDPVWRDLEKELMGKVRADMDPKKAGKKSRDAKGVGSTF